MNIMELGAIGELVGGVAVVASLIYVGLQVRQSNRQAKDTAAVEAANQYDRFMEMLVTNPKAREMWMIGTGGGAQAPPFKNPGNLDPDDLTLFAIVMARAWHQFESRYRAWRSGSLEDEQWSKTLPFIHQHLSGEQGLDAWRIQRQGWHSDGFTAFVDNEVRELQSAERA